MDTWERICAPLTKSKTQEADKLVTGSNNDKDKIFIIPNYYTCHRGWLAISRVLSRQRYRVPSRKMATIKGEEILPQTL